MFAKLHLSQSADAAAYAAAVVQARSLNAHAYLNRSQLAHQVAMAHWVTLGSAVKFMGTQASRSLQRNPPPWLIGTLFGAQYAGSYVSAQKMISPESIVQTIQKHHDSHNRQIHQDIARSRSTLINVVTQARLDVIDDILARNLSAGHNSLKGTTLANIGVSYELVLDEFQNRVQVSSTQHPEWREFLETVTGMYGYLKPRNVTKINWWWPNIQCPIFRPKLRRRGNTSLDKHGRWQSSDNLSYHAIKFNRLIGCYEREYPMGWGLAQEIQSDRPAIQNQSAPWDFSKMPFWRWFKSVVQLDGVSWFSSKNSLADAWAQQTSQRFRSGGFAQFSHLNRTDRRSFTFQLIVKQKGFSVLGIPFELVVRSKAEAYFEPPRLSAVTEYQDSPHLYYAFWHAKLSPQDESLLNARP